MDDTKTPATEPEQAVPASRPRRRRWLGWLAGSLLALVLMLATGVGVLLGTQSGLRWGLELAQRLAPETLSVGQIEGRVRDRLRLSDLTVTLPTLNLHFGLIELDWSPRMLPTGVLAVKRLAVSDLDVALAPKTEEDDAPLTLPAIVLPLGVEVGEIHLERLRILTMGVEKPLFALESARLVDSRFAGGELDLGRLDARLLDPALSASLRGRATLTEHYPLDLDLDWALSLPPEARLAGAGRVSGDLQRLALTQTLSGSVEAELTTEVRDLLGTLGWDGQLNVARVDLPSFQADLPPIEVQARLKTQGTLAEAALSGTLDAHAPDRPEFGQPALALDLLWTEKRLMVRTLELNEPVSTADLRLQGELDLSQEPSRFALEGDWKRLRWPLSGELIAESNEGALTASGSFESFVYQLSGQVASPGAPSAGIALIGQGTATGTVLESFALDTLDGRLEGAGTLTWAPELAWDLSLGATNLNPGVYVPDWPGRIDGRLTSQGTLGDDGPRLTAVIETLSGRLRDYPIAASGQVRMEGDSLQVEGLSAASGPSQLRVDGRLDQSRLDLSFALDSPDLANLWPEARGRLTATGRVQGTTEAPRVTFDLNGDQMVLAENALAELRGTADLDLAPSGRFSLQLRGRDLVAGGMSWSGLELRGDGQMSDHRLSARLTGQPLGLSLEATGALAEGGSYSGRVSSLQLDSQDWGTWSLQRPLPLTLDGERIVAGPLCLRQAAQGAGGCVGFEQTAAGRWAAELDLDRLDFALLKDLLPETLIAEGAGRIKGRFQANGAILSGTATAEIPKGRVQLAFGKGQREELDFSNAQLTLNSGANGLSTRLAIPLAGLGQIEADLSLPGWRLDAPARPAQSLRGRLRAEIRDLTPLASLAPDISGLKGRIETDLTLGGTLSQPGVSGRFEVKDVNFQLPLLALKVKDMTISARAPSFQSFDIRGTANLGGGQLTLTGSGGTDGAGPTARLRIEGEKLKLADTKEYFVRLSPGIDIEVSPGGAVVRGEIRVPEARIRPRSLPTGTVSPSSDVVLETKERGTAFPVTLDLRLVFGNEVTIDAFGVRGRLSGALRVLQNPGRDMLGDGQLQITEGQYRLSGGFGIAAELGAPLTITQGRLIYAKSPIGNPGLLLQAEREGGDTTAGVRVIGTLRTPKMTFFSDSDPGMTQADITKYLMTGIPPSANDRTEQAGLTVGTYIAPKIYMEYESGLGDEPNKVKLRYDVSKHIEFQSENGESQGADIFFKFEN
ncbi:translocation/assembly module TamB domain-containing protein [Allochromatium palmeri]|uniref:Translocation/assembly module TamB n=1 Tax=Allochromatium palmeri TaxID=231048 RepID=A0A6N8E7K8_9GAMM|nr:translocation/assembly module TamB domain-containing protein [Allochromatium palmeri]MTW20135.1 translocation/assembly module TamB [Allochromatium palmeri]